MKYTKGKRRINPSICYGFNMSFSEPFIDILVKGKSLIHVATNGRQNSAGDAGLVVAGPAMYEALKEVEAYFDFWTSPDDIGEAEKRLLKQVAAAIEKAEERAEGGFTE